MTGLHYMRLEGAPFTKIRNGSKTIELRLNDEKRRRVKVGDFIEFSLLDDETKKLTARVTALHPFKSFAELYASLPKEKLGYAPDETPDPAHMDAYYSKEEQEKCGALGIELRVTALQRFINAQNTRKIGETYERALLEIQYGRKYTHWMWYIFPQIIGLGHSKISVFFSIRNITEAVDYIEHPVLGGRLKEISSELLKLDKDDPTAVFGRPDDYKLRSCMTLFKHAAPQETVFGEVLDKYCMGAEDEDTVRILEQQSRQQ